MECLPYGRRLVLFSAALGTVAESRKRVVLPSNQNEVFGELPTFCDNFWLLYAVYSSDYPINKKIKKLNPLRGEYLDILL